jgi:ATP-dependent helicase YprA (DUF1998 family)
MGTDFLRNKKERHTKAWRQGISRTESDWITAAPRVTRVFRAKGIGSLQLAANQAVVLRLLAGNRVVASVGVHEVATLVKPSLGLVKRLKESQGIGAATVHRTAASAHRVDLIVEE